MAFCQDQNLTTLPAPSDVINPQTRVLRGLFAQSNQIIGLSRDMLVGFHWLTHLDLSRNDIRYIERRAFQPLKNLLHLDLSYNRIRELTSLTFHGLSNLKYLSLKSNDLRNLRRSEVSMMTSLRHLDIEKNDDLDAVDKGTFDKVKF